MVISYPIPPYQNLPIEPQFYIPNFFIITGIDIGNVTTITTSIAMNYVLNQQVRLIIPNGYGSTELNEKSGFIILIISPTQVVLNINSIGSSNFTTAPLAQKNKPYIVAIGDSNTGAINANGNRNTSTVIPGSFQNISPL